MATSGAVLEGAKASQTNSAHADLPTCGVARDFKSPSGQPFAAISPAVVDLHGSQYAASFLDDAQPDQTQYAVWAANSSQVALVPITTTDANTKGVVLGTGDIPQGNLTVGSHTDGADFLAVQDTAGRAVGKVLAVVLRQGSSAYFLLVGTGCTAPTVVIEDSNGDPVVLTTISDAFSTVDPDAGYVGLSTATLTALGGGVSQAGGDAVYSSYLVLDNQKFWWSKNDAHTDRFTYDAKTQKWLPIKGQGVQDVGVVTSSGTYTLSPPVRNFDVGEYLPASATDSDKYAMLRAGIIPSAAASTPLAYVASPTPGQFSGIRVVNDADVAGFQFTGADASLSGVVGLSKGSLHLNPAFATANLGLHLWYSAYTFNTASVGVVGALKGADSVPLFIAPIPAPNEMPFLKVGSRRYLTAITVANDAALLAHAPPADSQVIVSLSTGRLRFSTNLPKYADSTDALFNPSYLGAQVLYDGVACCGKAQPLRQPSALVDGAGAPVSDVSVVDTLYLAPADPFGANGLGTSGIFYLPDDTGSLPQTGTPPVRAGGDNLADDNIGLVRRIGSRNDGYALGDDVFYWYDKAFAATSSVGYESGIPWATSWNINEDTALVTEQAITGELSRVQPNSDVQESISGPIYYLNALFTPAAYTATASLTSRIRNSFAVRESRTEKLWFTVDADSFLWSATLLVGTALTFTAEQMAASLLLAPKIGGGGTLGSLHPNAVSADRGYLTLKGTTSVSIGFGTPDLDLSGCRATGFLAGWQATAGQDNWYNDSGLSFGMARSPLNLSRTSPDPDYIDRVRTIDRVLTSDLKSYPYLGVDYAPLRDVVGYGVDTFFRRIATVKGQPVTQDLLQYEDVLYDFAYNRFAWLEAGSIEALVIQPASELSLGHTGLVPDTMLGVDPNPTGGLSVATGNGAYQTLKQGTEYILPDDGQRGPALLIEAIGGQVANGYRGVWASGTSSFSDTQADFATAGVAAGYLLRVYPTGSPTQTYTVSAVTGATSLIVIPAFTTDSTGGNWQVFKGETEAVYDRAVVADMVYENFDPLPDQTFIVHLLSPLGTVPVDAAAQTASRLKANVDDALANARAINLRFGKDGGDTANLTLLGQQELGSLANGLFVQGVGTLRYTTQSFSLLVGDKRFSHGSLVTPLTPVAVFSSNPVGAEYLTTTGELKFNAPLLSSYSGSLVYQADEFLPAASLTAGQAEFKQSGDLNLSAADLTSHPQVTVFFEEALNAGTDMTINPMAGAFFLDKPLRAYQLVKCHYWQASPSGEIAVDVSGNPVEITEFLPFYVSMEKAVRVDSTHYMFDPADSNGFTHTVRQTITPTAYVGSVLQNYGQTTTATFDYTTRTITLLTEVTDTTTPVKVSYAVDEAFGGERTFNVSTLPVFQPPFFLPADVSTFKLAGLTSLVAGQMLRLGASTFYIQNVSYDVHEVAVPSLDAPYLSYPNTTGITTVDFFPPTIAEAGSRSPAQQALTLITARPVTDSVNGTTTTAPAGLFLTITTPYEPVSRGQTSITFKGPVEFSTSTPVTAGMILEIGGHPYTVADSQLSDDGTQQRVSVTAPFIYFYEPANGDTVRLSVRPVYPQGAKQFLPIGPVVASQEVELLYFAEGKAGVLLQSDIDYKVNTNTGAFQLISQTSKGLQAGDRYLARYTAQRLLSVQFANGIPQIPRYSANYRFTTLPSTDNGLLGSTIQARYTFAYPDSFYCRDLPLLTYLGEFAQTIASLTQQLTSQSGGPVFSSSSISLADHGQPSLLSQRMTLTNQDRAARQYLSFYNDLIVGFEQVLETINGQIVGDRDGKFRFYNEDAGLVPTPGMTEPITGTLTPRNIYSSVWNAYASSYVPLLQTDYLVDPYQSYSLVDGVLDGSRTDASLLSQLIAEQTHHIRNDIDDILLTRSNGIKFKLLFSLYSTGHYENMAEPNPFSRLFPEQTRGMMITAPGLDADLANGYGGKYAFMDFSKLGEEGIRSTFLKQIAQVSNPALGDITNLSSIATELRTPRAWVWGFFPDGIPADALYTGQTAVTDPCVIGTVLPLGQIPVNPVTGYPDMTLFASQAGPTGLPDLTTGDPSILLPYWQSAQFGRFWDVMQLEAGTPDGRSVAITGPSLTVDNTPGGLYVREVLHGCVLTFSDYTYTPITSASQLINLAGGLWTPVQGDTLLVQVRPDPSNTSLYQTLRFNDNSDVIARFASGSIEDFTIFHTKGNSPAPLQFWQSNVGFTNNNLAPLDFPALQGQSTLDSGDYSFPFLRANSTELVRFGQITDAMADVMTARSPLPNQFYIYPDEILLDGSLQTSYAGLLPPATLLMTQDLTPSGTGKGSLSQFDLLLVQTDTGSPTLPSSAEGFLSVADYAEGLGADNAIEVPRFYSQTVKGAHMAYTFENVCASDTLTGTLAISEDHYGVAPNVAQPNSGAGLITTLLDFGTLGSGFLDDGKNAGAFVPSAGGFNSLLADPNNVITITIYNTVSATTQGGVTYAVGDYVEKLLIQAGQITTTVGGDPTPPFFPPPPITVFGTSQFGWNDNHLLLRFEPTNLGLTGRVLFLDTASITRFGAITHTAGPPGSGLYTVNKTFNFSVSVDTLAGGSDTASLGTDRLTFSEVYDLTHAKARGARQGDGGWDLQAKLLISDVETRDSANVSQNLSYLYLNGKTDTNGCPFTFLSRNALGSIGTFSPASATGAGDEEGTVKVMGWEGVLPVGSGAVLIANLVAGQVDTISVVNGGTGYLGGFVELVIAAPPSGRTATAVATVVGGIITTATVKLKGNGYVVNPAVGVWHYAGNQPIAATTSILASAIPSSPEDEIGVIALGNALLSDVPILRSPTATVAKVVKGDTVWVRYSATDPLYKATEKAGTYLVRHAIDPDAPSGASKSLNLTSTVGLNSGWVHLNLPTVVSWDATTFALKLNTLGRFGGIVITGATSAAQTTLMTAVPHGYSVGNAILIRGANTVPDINGSQTVVAVTEKTLTIDFNFVGGIFTFGGRILEAAEPSPPHLWQNIEDYGAFPHPTTYFNAYGNLPRVYAVTNLNGPSTEVVSMEYTNFLSDVDNNLLRLLPGSAQDKDGVGISDADFFASLSVGQSLCGMVYFPITLEGLTGMPSDNIAAYTTGTVNGLQALRFENTSTANVSDYPLANLTSINPYVGYTPPVVGAVGSGVCLPRDSDRFILRRNLAVYPNVLGTLDLMGVANNHAGQLAGAAGKPHILAGAECLLTGDMAITNDGTGTKPLKVLAGIYLEPSFPVSSLPVVGGPWVAEITQIAPFAGGKAQVTLTTPTNFRQGDLIAIGGNTDSGANATWTIIDYLSTTDFTIGYAIGGVGLGGDLWGAEQSRLVDKATNPVLLQTIGTRYGTDGYAGFEQLVHYNVRRIRRFHDANNQINANFLALRYAYETRRGIITAYTATNKQTATLTAANYAFPVDDPDYAHGALYTGTQLGPFTSPDVNVQAGDLFRLIDPTLPPSEQVLETVLIKEVAGDGTLVLETPGLQTSVVVGLQFEVWLRNAVVPHQQSCDQLLDLVTTKTLLDRVANRTTKKGGYVSVPYGPNRIPGYPSAVNKLQDDLMPVGKTFANYDVQVGDIVVIDPQGVVGLSNGISQRGTRPFGDVSIVDRGAAYTAGKPDLIDDNRGFYRVTKIDTTNNLLVVDGSSACGISSAASPATFPKSALGKTARGYAVYPTVHDSTNIAPSGEEGQTVLRPTSLPGVDNDNAVVAGQPDSYAVNEYSIRPFSYRIIRPTGLLSAEAIDLILSMRERMLSLIEQFKVALLGQSGGDYWTFQYKEFGRDLGYPTLPDTGTGVFRNLVIEDIMGRVDTTPFTNDADCLSVLDRRFWILDQRLDSLTKDGTGYGMKVLPVPAPPGVVAYTSYNTKPDSDVRPVLPDRISIVLDYRDRLRAQRFSWITYRAHRLTGTLANIGRFDSQYATARAQQVSAMQQTRSLT